MQKQIRLIKEIFAVFLCATSCLVNAEPISRITSFAIVNADTNRDITVAVSEGAVNSKQTPRINIRAVVGKVGSVVFSNGKIENATPYAFNGDKNGDYLPWSPKNGIYTITATAYSEKNGKGKKLSEASFQLTVRSGTQPIPTTKPTVRPTSTATPIKSPSATPIKSPSATPIKSPSATPIKSPSVTPIKSPSVTPIRTPLATPIKSPSVTPIRTPLATPTKLPTAAPTATSSISENGVTLYNTYCAACHQPLNNSTKKGKTFDTIKMAITLVPAMKVLQLTDNQIRLIAGALEIKEDPQAALGSNSLAARLTKQQYIYTLQDLFKVSLSQQEIALIPNEVLNETGFSTNFEAQNMSNQHILAYNKIAKSVVEKIDASAFVSNLSGCNNISAACQANVVNSVGKNLLRKPLSPSELKSFVDPLSIIGNMQGVTFAHISRWALESMLQSPQFLYRLERETEGSNFTRPRTGYEFASWLSYFIWQSMPDNAGLDFAAQIERSGYNQSALEAEVDRMLKDPKAMRSLNLFWSDYTKVSSTELVDVSAKIAAELKGSLMTTLVNASGLGIQGLEIPLQDLFTLEDMALTPSMGASYGLTSKGSAGQGYNQFNVGSLPNRSGILTHPGFVAMMGSDSFVMRGITLTERVLCRKIANVPAGIEDEITQAMLAVKNSSPRESSEFRFSLGGQCETCHKQFEPIAYAFERFDRQGLYTLKTSIGGQVKNLFTDGYLQEEDGSVGPTYTDAKELMNLLATSEETSKCFVQNMWSFATGFNHESKLDRTAITQAHDVYMQNMGTYKALIKAIATHKKNQMSKRPQND